MEELVNTKAMIVSLFIHSSTKVYSGVSCHATPHRKLFHDYVPGYFGHVLLGDDEPCKIVGMGKVRIKLKNGNEWLLKYIRHNPAMKRNSISTGRL